nr:MAG TPA: hypothetical protein [Caudoviricetes sp.]
MFLSTCPVLGLINARSSPSVPCLWFSALTASRATFVIVLLSSFKNPKLFLYSFEFI